jgi:hypothetical protein
MQIHNGVYPVLQNSHYYILTPTHPHVSKNTTNIKTTTRIIFHISSSCVLQIHAGKTLRREYGDLNIPAATLPAATLRRRI